MTRHKVFISYHHANDEYYKNKFEELFSNSYFDIIISKSVQIGDINEYLPAETIRQKIRDEYLRDSTVTVVLIGSETWKRKHVDWEIGASLRDTQYNSRSGLIGILLPSYSGYTTNTYNPHTIPPRLAKNIEKGFAEIYKWSTDPHKVKEWIEEAFKNRKKILPTNTFPSFKNNRSGSQWQD